MRGRERAMGREVNSQGGSVCTKVESGNRKCDCVSWCIGGQGGFLLGLIGSLGCFDCSEALFSLNVYGVETLTPFYLVI